MAPRLIPVVGPDRAQSSFFASGLGVRGFQVAGLGGSPRGQGDRLLCPSVWSTCLCLSLLQPPCSTWLRSSGSLEVSVTRSIPLPTTLAVEQGCGLALA